MLKLKITFHVNTGSPARPLFTTSEESLIVENIRVAYDRVGATVYDPESKVWVATIEGEDNDHFVSFGPFYNRISTKVSK